MSTWYIIDGNLPFLYEFPERPRSINNAPLGIWTIRDGNLPTKATFPPRIPIDGAPVGIWVIRDGNLPYKSSFPEKSYITDVPYGIWAIRDGKLPFKRNFPPMYRVVPWKVGNEYEFWYVGRSPWGYQIRKAWAGSPNKVQLMEDIGPTNIDACLEADGLFEMQGESFLVHTIGIPWMFVVTNEGKLYAKKCLEDVHTAQLLATNVIKVSAVRGWRNPVFDVDSGITVAYLKTDGSAWMRTSDNSTFTHWEQETCLDASPNVNIQAFRLNDFRTAIFVEGVNRVFISPRYYIGGTSKTEYLDPKLDIDLMILSVTAEDGPHDDLVVTEVELKNNIEFWVRCNYPFVYRDPSWGNEVSITSNPPVEYQIESYRVEAGALVIRMTRAFTSPYAYITFRVNPLNRIRFKRTEQSIPICPQLDIVYDNPASGYNTEQLNPEITSVSVTLGVRPVTVYEYNYIDSCIPNLAVDATCIAEEVGNEQGYNSETCKVQFSVTATLIVEQSGVTPV